MTGLYVPSDRSGAGAMTAVGCGFNWSMQHLVSNYREEDVEYEVSNEDHLVGNAARQSA